MKLKTINYFYELARVIFYLRWHIPCSNFIFNDRIFIRKYYKARQIPITDNTRMRSFKIYKNMNLEIVALSKSYNPIDFKEFHHEVMLDII